MWGVVGTKVGLVEKDASEMMHLGARPQTLRRFTCPSFDCQEQSRGFGMGSNQGSSEAASRAEQRSDVSGVEVVRYMMMDEVEIKTRARGIFVWRAWLLLG